MLDGIVAQVSQISTIVADIAASAQEQASGLTQVNQAVNEMDQVTQQNAAMVEQSTAASRSLAHEANELGRLMGTFKIHAHAGARPAASLPLQPPRGRAHHHDVPAGAQDPRPCALAPRPAAQENEWEDF